MKPKTALGRRRRRLLLKRRLLRLAGAGGRRLPRRLACLLAAVLVAAGSVAGIAVAANARAATPVNEGDPFQNGDFVWQANKNTYRLSGVTIHVGGLADLGAAAAPYDYPGCLEEANRLFLAGNGGGNWPGWGVSDYAYSDVTVTNTRNIKFTVLPTRGHCAQANNATSYFGNRDGYLNLEPDKSWWNDDHTVYHGVFFMAIDNGHASGVFDQSTFGTVYIYADWEVSGALEIRKRSAEPALTKGDDSFSLADARYSIYRDRDCTDRVATVATDENGNAKKEGLSPGTYWVRETKASKGYEKTESAVKAVVEAGKTVRVATDGDYWREIPRGGYVRVAKKAADDGLVALAPSRYSKAGAEYGIYTDAACTKATGQKIVTDAAGNGKSAELDAGTYYIKETKASPGYGLDPNIHGPLKAVAGATASFTSLEPLLLGYLDLVKKSSSPGITDGNRCYSLAGAEYSVYGDSACTGPIAAKLTTDADGYAKSAAIPAGRYWVRETKAAPGYELDAAIYGPYAVGGGTTERVNGSSVADKPCSNPASIFAAKLDGETLEGAPVGGATLEGCEFTVRYYDGSYDSVEACEASGDPIRTWVVRTDGNGRAELGDRWLVGGDSLYRDERGIAVIPLGTVLVQETGAPEGYLVNDEIDLAKVTAEASEADPHTRYHAPSIPDFVKRGDLSLDKYKHSDLARLSGIPFRITALDTGESHILVTDENGQAKTSADWNRHSFRTNANDDAVAADGTVDESKLDPQAGIWFGLDADGRPTAPRDDRGALPYGTYRVEELPVDRNHAMEMIAFEFKVYKDGYEFHAELPNHLSSSPYITTSAIDKDTYTKTAAVDSTTTIIDRVDYQGLDTNDSGRFTLRATLVEAQTGAPVTDAGGNPVAAEQLFCATGPAGSVQMEVVFDSRAYAGCSVVVFEELYDDAGNLVCSHKDVTDVAQTIRIAQPALSTVARDGADDDKLIAAEPASTVIDAVACRGLKPGASYTIAGSINKVTEGGSEPLADGDGNPVTASRDFIADGPEAVIDVAFTMDTAAHCGGELVLFEELWMDGTLLTAHSDPMNKDQTVAVEAPTIATAAVDAADGDKEVSAEPGAAIADTVQLDGLAAGSTYQVKGSLHLVSGEGAEPLCDKTGAPIEAECTFTADSSGRTLKLVFPFEGQVLAGRSIVVYEHLYKDGTLLASHADAADGAQTVAIAPPEMSTTAVDGADGDKSVAAGHRAKVVDTVAYSGLAVDTEYRIEGTLNAVGENGATTPLTDEAGAPITSGTAFTPTDSRGEEQVVFEFDASSLAGRKLVVYERLLRDGIEVLSHEDPQDPDQTVEVALPLLATEAQDGAGGGKAVMAAPDATVRDAVSYSGIEPGTPLILHAIMVDPSTTLPLLAYSEDGPDATGEGPEAEAFRETLAGFWEAYGRLIGFFGEEERPGAPAGTGSPSLDAAWATRAALPNPVDAAALERLLSESPALAERLVTAQASFTPEASSGTVALEYSFDGRGLRGRAGVSLVWAENDKGEAVAVHADPAAASQTVGFYDDEPLPSDEGSAFPKTGALGEPWAKLMLALGLAAAVTGGLAFCRQKRGRAPWPGTSRGER